MNTNIAMQDTSPQFESPMNALAKVLQIKQAQQESQLGQMKMDEYRTGRDRTNRLQSLLSGEYSNPQARQDAMLKGGFLTEANDYSKAQGELAKQKAATEKDQLGNTITKLTLGAQILGSAKDQATYDAARATAHANGLDVTNMPPQFDPAFVKAKFDEGMDVKTKLEQVWKQKGYDLDVSKFGETVRNNKEQTATTQRGQNMTAGTAAAGRAQSAAQFGVTSGLASQRLEFDKTKPVAKKTGPMSVTLQKELLESDDVAQASGNVIGMLETAKKKNKDAYSGYFAKGRAVFASNMPGATPGADATIDIDNMMTGQALENLKVIFGGMPTEGERKILMEMQASVDKTPKQREAIMDRGIAAAKKRGEYAKQKAKAIRSGDYLTEGMPAAAADPLDSLLDKYK